MITDYGSWTLDISTWQMILTWRLLSFGFSHADSFKPKEQLSKYQYAKRIENLPNYFKFLSFAFFFISFSGPTMEYVDYDDFMHRRGNFANPPSAALVVMRELLWLLIVTVPTLYFLPMFPLSTVTTEWFGEKNFLWQFGYTTIIGTLLRCRYYVGFMLGQVTLHTSGFSYNGKDAEGNNRWDFVRTADPMGELSGNCKIVTESWNISVQNFLRNHVYLRLVHENEMKSNPKKANYAQKMTYILSAFWHGFYPSYYFAFVFWAFCAEVDKSVFKMNQNIKFTNNIVIKKSFEFVLKTLMNWAGIVFFLPHLADAYTFLLRVKFSGVIVLAILFMFFQITRFGQKSSKPKSQQRHEHGKRVYVQNNQMNYSLMLLEIVLTFSKTMLICFLSDSKQKSNAISLPSNGYITL
eukprot:TRINITY_DN530_c0_g1_i8.p1 TRINITY_DN530_c0_g1~~TRINITY_DN530_c0_g1_i8.p1  ORF type:complete len:409 (-),score=48.87 TRINITY_DN530_c0_g1_i8:106-1332(-)